MQRFALAVSCALILSPFACGQSPPEVKPAPDVVFPDAPTPPAPPAPPEPTPSDVVNLQPGVLYVFSSNVPCVVKTSAGNVVSITKHAGPILINGFFYDKPGVRQTKTYKSKFIWQVESIPSDKPKEVALFVVPSTAFLANGEVNEGKATVTRIAANLGPQPPPPGPGPGPGPTPPPIPVQSGAWAIVVVDDVNPTAEQGRVVASDVLNAYRQAGRCRTYGIKDDAAEIASKRYDVMMRDAALTAPCVLVLDKAGKKVAAVKLPTTPEALAVFLKGVMLP